MNINLVSVSVSIISTVYHIQISFINVFKIPISGLDRIAPYVYYLRYTIEVFFLPGVSRELSVVNIFMKQGCMN